MRPICSVCSQRPCAINYRREDVTHYRSKCENCIRKGRNLPRRRARWQTAGYQKSKNCDCCGFRARYSAQLLVYHIDGRLNNVDIKNLRSICLNCAVEIKKSDSTWRPGDLEPDH